MEENMKRFNIKSLIALIITVAMLLTGIPYSDIKAYADVYTAESIGQEVSLPDNKVGTLSGYVEINTDNIYKESGGFDYAGEGEPAAVPASEQAEPDNCRCYY